MSVWTEEMTSYPGKLVLMQFQSMKDETIVLHCVSKNTKICMLELACLGTWACCCGSAVEDPLFDINSYASAWRLCLGST